LTLTDARTVWASPKVGVVPRLLLDRNPASATSPSFPGEGHTHRRKSGALRGGRRAALAMEATQRWARPRHLRAQLAASRRDNGAAGSLRLRGVRPVRHVAPGRTGRDHRPGEHRGRRCRLAPEIRTAELTSAWFPQAPARLGVATTESALR